ncbi:MAG: SUMF1/EgtB/PvdO family nonheme iron enzyme [Fibrobacterota bacterium]|nr:SUMF1/EgtB/PvdO family nonheme iron enzyme [Fibrobacterota bacterium]QQS05267.1 MAG: SUMF1/EgtB/PvdO family nonheme iron enzyme [Fibrobacterota bacterium]
MLPVFSVLSLLFSANLTEIVSNDLGLDPTLHRFAGMSIGQVDRSGDLKQDGFVAKGDRWEPSIDGASISWQGFRFLAKRGEMSVSLDGKEGEAKRLWIDGSCNGHELVLPSDPIRWKDARLQEEMRFLAPAGCEILMYLEDPVAGLGIRLSMDSVSFDASGRARLGVSTRVAWMTRRRWGGSVDNGWRDTIQGTVVMASGVRLPDTIRLRQDLRNPRFLSKEMLVAGGKLYATGFRGWPGYEVPAIESVEIDREGGPVDVPAGRLQSIRVSTEHFLTWSGDVAVRGGSLVVGKARDFRLVEIVSDEGTSGGPLDGIGRKMFVSDTMGMTLIGDTLVANRPSLQQGMNGWLDRTLLKVPLHREESGDLAWLNQTIIDGGVAGLTDSTDRLVVFPQPENDDAPGIAPRRKLALHLDAGIKISYRVGRSGNFRDATEARADLGEWGGATAVVEYGYDPDATSISFDRTPLGHVVFLADREPPVTDFAFPWLQRWGRFLPGKRVRQTGAKDKIVCEGRFLPNDAWRKFTGKDTLTAFVTVPVSRDSKGRMKIVRSGEGVIKVPLPRQVFLQEGVQPIGLGMPLSLRLDARGEAGVGDHWNEWYVEAPDSVKSQAWGGYWKWANLPVGLGSAKDRAIYRGGFFKVGVDAKPVAWETYWRTFAGKDSLLAPDGSVLRGCRKIDLSWVETENGISQWSARAPSLVRKALGESEWAEPKGDTDLVWREGKGFSNWFGERSTRRSLCLDKSQSSEKPVEVDGIGVDRAPATVGEWNECVLAKACPAYQPEIDPTRQDHAYALEMAQWSEVRAEGIGFGEAKAYCRFRSSRLPTQKEWAKVIGTSCGSYDHPEFCEGLLSERPQPVAQGRAYSSGVYDLVGRGAVWCADGRPCPRGDFKAPGSRSSDPTPAPGSIGVQCVHDLAPAPSKQRTAP